MGVSLAKVALSATWAHLPPPARILFAHMAIIAQDQAKRPIYFGGRDALVLALDGELLDAPEAREVQYRRLRRHLEELRMAGAIEDEGHAHRRRRAEYVLQVMPKGGHALTPKQETEGGHSATPKAVEKGGHSVTAQGGHSVTAFVPERGSLSDRKGGHPVTPLGTTEEQRVEEQSGGDIEPVPAQPHLGVRAGEPSKRERCAECGRSERDCRARVARHGGHEYRPIELAPLRLA